MRFRRGKEARAIAIAFLTALILRGLPELRAPAYPVGYDVPLYAVEALHLLDEDPLYMLSCPPLVFAILWLLYIPGPDVLIVLKLLTPVLYGLLAISFYAFLRKYLGLDVEKSLFCTILCMFQPTVLRISWDLLKMELGLTGLFLLLAYFEDWQRSRRWPLATALMLVVVLSHQLPAVLMFMFLAYEWWRVRTPRRALELLALALPATCVFIIQLLIFTGAIRAAHPVRFRDVIWLRSSHGGMPVIGVPFPRNYFLENPFRSASWADIALYVPLTLVALFALLLPTAIMGLRRHGFLDVMATWLVFASLSVIACPWAYPFAHFFRWMLMMAFPLSIYAAEGAFKLAGKIGRRRALAAVLIPNAIMGVIYAYGLPCSGANIPSPMFAYMPDHMAHSTIELDEIDDCKACISWLNAHGEVDSVLVIEQRFFAWALMWLDERMPIAVYRAGTPLDEVELDDVFSAYEHVYTIWYKDRAPCWRGHGSAELFSSGDLAVYEFARGPGGK